MTHKKILDNIINAGSYGDLQKVTELITKHKEKHTNINLNSYNFFYSIPILIRCIHFDYKIFKYIVECGGKVNALDLQHRSPLSYACEFGYLDKVKYLFENNAKTYMIDKYRWSPITYACRNDHIHIVKYLIDNGTSINNVKLGNFKYIDKTTNLFLVAYKYNAVNTMKYLLDNPKFQRNILINSCECNYTWVIKTLVNKDVPITTYDILQYPILKSIVEQKNLELFLKSNEYIFLKEHTLFDTNVIKYCLCPYI